MTVPEQSPVDFGTMFRQARERRGVTLQQVAAVTKISARVIEALERNDVSKLPGGIFSRAFVRSYAREIGLDPEMAIDRFTSEFPDESGREEMPSTKDAEDIEAFESRRRMATTIVQLLGLSLVVLVAVFFALNSRACGKSQEAAPAASSPPVSAPANPVAALPVATARPSESSPPPEQAAATTADPTTGEAPASGAGSAAVSAASIEITITAEADCWLMVKADSGVVFERLMRAGEHFARRAEKTVTLTAGNAGGLALTLNGKPGRPLGSSGQVVTATITPDTIAAFLK